MVKYRLTNEAVKDLEEIWSYTKHKWSLEQADRYYNLIIDEIGFIASNPLLGRSIDYIKEGYRRCVCGVDSIYYRIENGTVEIMAIIGRQDLNSIL